MRPRPSMIGRLTGRSTRGGARTATARPAYGHGSGKSARELRLAPLVAGIAVLFALGIVALVGAVLLAGRQADRLATADSIAQVSRVMAGERDGLATLNRDWAWWNEGIERLVLAPDLLYADVNLGDYAVANLGLLATLVVDPADRPIFGYLRGRRLATSELARWTGQLAPLIAATRAASRDEPRPAVAFVELGGAMMMVSASAMMAEIDTAPVDWPQPAVLIFARAVDRAMMDAIAQSAGVEAVHLVEAAERGETSVVLPGPDGGEVGALVWEVRLPSIGILAELWPLGAAIAAVMVVLGGLICVYLVRHGRDYHRARLLHERALSTAMLEAREASHAKSLFLANMSHELRTPLNAVIGYSQLLRLSYVGELSQKQREYVDSIEGAGRHLLSMLQDILDLSKIEAGREELDDEDVALDEVAAKAVALVAPRARERGVAISVEAAGRLRLRADGRRLVQMLVNLLSNGVRFSPKGGVLSVTWRSRPGGEVEIVIRDQGPGIREADMERVLQPFHRKPEHAAHVAGDSNGLGLPLTARLMTLHDGRLELSNAPSGGLAAALVFPAARCLAAAANEGAAPGGETPVELAAPPAGRLRAG